MVRVSPTVVWSIVAIVALVLVTTGVTLAVLLIERSKGAIGPSSFACSIATPSVFPACGLSTVNTGIPGEIGSGFFTSNSLKVFPTVKPTSTSISPTPPMVGYYHSHPTAYYNGILYSYPFVLQIIPSGSSTVAPTFHLTADRFSATAQEVATSPFDQFAFINTGTDIARNGYSMKLPTALGGTPIGVDREPYPLDGTPTLTSMLSTERGGIKTSIIATQGIPYIMVDVESLQPLTAPLDVLTLSSFGQYTTTDFVVHSITYTAYIFTLLENPNKSLVWYVISAIPQSLNVDGNDVKLTLEANPTALRCTVYVTMFANVGTLLPMVMQIIANSLLPPFFIRLVDVIPSPQNTALQYTITPKTGGPSPPGSFTLWIVPPTSFSVSGLAGVVLPAPGYLDFPIGNGLFRTNLQAGIALTSFFTIWPPAQSPLSDFTSYALPNAGSGLRDTTSITPDSSDSDLYYLALANRILYANPGGQAATPNQINSCSTNYSTRINGMGVGQADYTIFTEKLGTQDAGLVSRIAYLLLSYVHMRAYLSLISNTESSNGVVANSTPQLVMLIEGGLTTASLSEQQASPSLGGAPVYCPLSFLETYFCTVPVIKTVGYTTPPPSLEQLSSRLGEVLGWLWASDYLVSQGFVPASNKVPRLARCLYSITLESTTRLMRGQCLFSSSALPNLAPVMPWTSIISHKTFGFQLDGASPGGTSPDAVFDQTFTPFTPASHYSIRPLLNPLAIAVEKLLRCSQPVPQSSPAIYNSKVYVDPALVSYFTYLYTTGNRTNMLLTGRVDEDLLPFIKMVQVQHQSVALLMNQVKLGVTSEVLVTRR